MSPNCSNLLPSGVILVDQLTANQREQLYELYQKEWWSQGRSREDVDFILDHSSFIRAAIQKDSLELLGFSRILTDFFKYAYLHDFIVKEEARSQGVGKLLLTSLLHHPILKQCARLEFTCKRDMVPYYEKFGFIQDPPDRVTMRRMLDPNDHIPLSFMPL